RLDVILKTRPDVIIVAGGTEGGASLSLMSLIESVGLACYLLPQDQKPEVLFAGNSELATEVDASLKSMAHLTIAPNVRPGLEAEQLMPAHAYLDKVFRTTRIRQLNGLDRLDSWSGGKVIPSASGIGRIIRFMSRAFNQSKGALGIDIGASATTVAAAFGGDLSLGVYPDLGLGRGVVGILSEGVVEDVSRWLTLDIPDSDISDYAYNKSVHPASLPASAVELDIEQALARQALRIALHRLVRYFPKQAHGSGNDLLPWFEPIIAGGGILTQAPTLGQALLILLDGLQPTGVTTLALDPNGLLPALGAAAEVNSILPIQVLDSSTFLSLGTLISPVGSAKYGSPVLKVKITNESGAEKSFEVKYGSLEVIPLGHAASVQIQPLNRFDVGMGSPGRGGTLTRVAGGALGLIIDARGRPLRLPEDANRRRELIKKWLQALGG
ncbi:MAG TPA: glutamate mutase L, partial [Anaerolineales bacterium]